MSDTAQWILILVGVMVSAGLLVYIFKHTHKQKEQRQAQARQEQLKNERWQEAVQSVRVLAMAIEQGQIDLSEGAIRIHGLLQVVAPELLDHERYRVFRKMAEETSHMPTHEERNNADKQDVQRMDQEKLALEKKHNDELQQAAYAIRRHPFNGS